MTRTEDWLTDALGARAEFVRQHSLRELVPPGLVRSRPEGRVWLGALATAAAVLLVVGGAAAIRNRTSDAGPKSATSATPPKYRVEVEEDSNVVARSTATGGDPQVYRRGAGCQRLK